MHPLSIYELTCRTKARKYLFSALIFLCDRIPENCLCYALLSLSSSHLPAFEF